MSFLYLTRVFGIGIEPRPIAVNSAHIIAIHPAVTFDHYGKPTFADGTDIWTTPIDSAEGTSAWRVVEDYGSVTGALADLRRSA